MSAQFTNDNNIAMTSESDYASLKSYYVATPPAPYSLAEKIPIGDGQYMFTGTSTPLQKDPLPNYDILTGSKKNMRDYYTSASGKGIRNGGIPGLNSAITLAQEIYANNNQPIQNITPTMTGQYEMNYDYATTKRFGYYDRMM